MHLLTALEPHQAVAVVAGAETFVLSPRMLENTSGEVAGDSDVERVAAAGDDVWAVAVFVPAAIVDRRAGLAL
jgi:hypothetical protein